MRLKVSDIREYFKEELFYGNFTTDKTGEKTIELIGASFLADEPAIFGTPSEQYIKEELDWYLSESTNINDIREGEPPVAWKYTANEHGEINSNYGHLVFSNKYHNQFENALTELVINPDSRRAEMVYNRPSIWVDFDDNGKNDFICTNAQTVYIRDGKLHMVSQMRSNDVVFGYKNDYAWAQYLMDAFVARYNMETGKNIVKGDLIWQVQNLHVYSKHFKLVV